MDREKYKRRRKGLAGFLAVLLVFQMTLPYLQTKAASTEETTTEAMEANEDPMVVEEVQEERSEIPEESEDVEEPEKSSDEKEEAENSADTMEQEDSSTVEHTAQDKDIEDNEAVTEEKTDENDETVYEDTQPESKEDWERELKKLELTDEDWTEDFARIADSQVGYKEDATGAELAEDGLFHGWTRYGSLYGDPYRPWNTLFIDFCLYYAQVEGMPFEPEISDWLRELQKGDAALYVGAEDAQPGRGDVIFLDLEEEDEKADAAGVVIDSEYDTDQNCEEVTVVLGDYEDEVTKLVLVADDAKILGYAVLPVDPRVEEESQIVEAEEEKEIEGEKRIVFEGTVGNIQVTAQASEEAFPSGTTMEVSLVSADEVLDAINQTVDGTITNVEAVNITFYNLAGEEVEPALPIRVFMSSDLIAQKEVEPTVVHIQDDESTNVVELDNDIDTQNHEVTFESDSFSVYAVVYTVDFSLTDKDGKTYAYSMEGGKQITLTSLLENLTGMENATAAKLVAEDVAKVDFSNDSLVKIVKLEERSTLAEILDKHGLEQRDGAEESVFEAPDYLLLSLQPFDTEEVLTVTLRSGEKIVIAVTDEQVTDINQIVDGEKYLIYVQWSQNGTCYVLRNDGTTVQVPANELPGLGDEYYWTITRKQGVTARYLYGDRIDCYTIRALTSPNYYLQPNQYPNGNATNLLAPWTDRFGCGIRQSEQAGTFEIGGFYDADRYSYGGFLVIENNEFRENYAYASDVKLFKKNPLATFSVETENASLGTVSGRDYQYNEKSEEVSFVAIADSSGYNSNAIVAMPKVNYEFVGWKWEGEQNYVYTSSTIPAGALQVRQGGTLIAVFKEQSEIENTGRHADSSLEEWINGLLEKRRPFDEESTSKTAEVYDYENRIYRVDLTTKSNLVTFNGMIDLGFVLDVSNSMKFPSKLDKTGMTYQVNQLNQPWYPQQLDRNQVYYIVTDSEKTATVRRLYYQGPGIHRHYYRESGAWKEKYVNDPGWHIADASFSNEYGDRLETTTYFGGDELGDSYTIYRDGDPGKTRQDYLIQSVTSAILRMQELIGKLDQLTNDHKAEISVGYVTFANADHIYSSNIFRSVNDPSDVDRIVQDLQEHLRQTDGGTRSDLGIERAASLSFWDGTSKYAVLITDGAPQGGNHEENGKTVSNTVDWLADQTKQKKQLLTNQGVKVMTVGLSLENVEVGRLLLRDLADKIDGQKMFYGAESGDDLYYILLEILQKIMAKATVVTNIEDTIDRAFYPVDKATGAPLNNGDLIGLDGNRLPSRPTDGSPYGTIVQYGNEYKVTWSSQNVSYDEGWHGTVYVKAKEDFLGGNTISTNDGDAVFTPVSYFFPENPGRKYQFENTFVNSHTYRESTPAVNVNNLHMSEESSEWTVYVGTEVDPVTQLKEMWEDITVQLFVNETNQTNFIGGNLVYDLLESPDDDRPLKGTAEQSVYIPDEVPISHYLQLSDEQWKTLLKKGTVEVDYSAYDHEKVGKFIVSLTSSETDVQKHKMTYSDQEDLPTEEYTLAVTYQPAGVSKKPEEYRTGNYGMGLPGKETDAIVSENFHDIKVFQKGLKILKVSSENDVPLSGAEFTLYRAAKEGEQGIRLSGDGVKPGMYVPAYKSTTNEVGEIVWNPIEQFKDSGVASGNTTTYNYYLVETKSPSAYAIFEGVVPVTLSITDEYATLKDEPLDQTRLSGNPYNWIQKAQLKIDTKAAGDRIIVDGDLDVQDSTTRTVKYKILNYQLYELPSSGGIGNYWFIFFGTAILAFAMMLFKRWGFTSFLRVIVGRQYNYSALRERRPDRQKE